MQAVVAGGAGIARLPDFLAAGAIARGEIIRVLPDHLGDVVEVHALYPSRHSISGKVRAFTDALSAHVHAERENLGPQRRPVWLRKLRRTVTLPRRLALKPDRFPWANWA